MLRTLLALLFVLVVPIGALAQQPRAIDLLSVYRDLNDLCRDRSDDDRYKTAVCNIREKVARLLNSMGYCDGKNGPESASVHWHKCTAHELF